MLLLEAGPVIRLEDVDVDFAMAEFGRWADQGNCCVAKWTKRVYDQTVKESRVWAVAPETPDGPRRMVALAVLARCRSFSRSVGIICELIVDPSCEQWPFYLDQLLCTIKLDADRLNLDSLEMHSAGLTAELIPYLNRLGFERRGSNAYVMPLKRKVYSRR